MEFLVWLENTGFGVWMREADYLYSLFPYTFFLAMHTVGLALLVGPKAAIDLRLLGVAPRLPLAPMEPFFRLMWIGFWLNAVTGVILVPGYAIIRLTDPVFYIKLGFIALAIVNLRSTHREVFLGGSDSRQPSARAKVLAGTSLGLWTAAIVTGRLLGYEYSPFVRWAALRVFLITTIVIAIVWAGGFIAARTLGWTKPVRQRG